MSPNSISIPGGNWQLMEGSGQIPGTRRVETLLFPGSALYGRVRMKNRFATHPINAMLNYAYGVLESSTRIKCIADGYDPTLGILHGSTKPGKNSFVFDLMEPQRPIADRAILKLIAEEQFCGADFILQNDGACRLNPELARAVARSVSAILTAGGRRAVIATRIDLTR